MLSDPKFVRYRNSYPVLQSQISPSVTQCRLLSFLRSPPTRPSAGVRVRVLSFGVEICWVYFHSIRSASLMYSTSTESKISSFAETVILSCNFQYRFRDATWSRLLLEVTTHSTKHWESFWSWHLSCKGGRGRVLTCGLGSVWRNFVRLRPSQSIHSRVFLFSHVPENAFYIALRFPV